MLELELLVDSDPTTSTDEVDVLEELLDEGVDLEDSERSLIATPELEELELEDAELAVVLEDSDPGCRSLELEDEEDDSELAVDLEDSDLAGASPVELDEDEELLVLAVDLEDSDKPALSDVELELDDELELLVDLDDSDLAGVILPVEPLKLLVVLLVSVEPELELVL